MNGAFAVDKEEAWHVCEPLIDLFRPLVALVRDDRFLFTGAGRKNITKNGISILQWRGVSGREI